jgi:hypothetical protein
VSGSRRLPCIVAVAFFAAALAATPAQAAQHKPGQYGGYDFGTFDDGFLGIGVKLEKNRFRVSSFRLSVGFYEHSRQLCGFQLGEEVVSTVMSSHVKYRPIRGAVSGGRFRWHVSRTVDPADSRPFKERISASGRITGKKAALMKVRFSSGRCTIRFRVPLKLNGPASPPPEADPWVAYGTVGDPASFPHINQSVSIRRGPRGWDVRVGLTNDCGLIQHPDDEPSAVQSHAGAIWELPYTGDRIEGKAKDAGRASYSDADGTLSITARQVDKNTIKGTVTGDITFTGDCPGAWNGTWRFEAQGNW